MLNFGKPLQRRMSFNLLRAVVLTFDAVTNRCKGGLAQPFIFLQNLGASTNADGQFTRVNFHPSRKLNNHFRVVKCSMMALTNSQGMLIFFVGAAVVLAWWFIKGSQRRD
jgi:hypothetical protein